MPIEIHRATVERVIAEAAVGKSEELRDVVLFVAGELLAERGLSKLDPMQLLDLDDATWDEKATPTVRAFASMVYLLHVERFNGPDDVTMMLHWASLLQVDYKALVICETIML